jgi:spore maturation protein CgeB
MRIVLFYHSLRSDWNHGNAHFLRGIATELIARGHEVEVFEPCNGWSAENLLAEHGTAPISAFEHIYPALRPRLYDLAGLDLDEALAGADLVLVHEWNEPELVAAIGRHHRQHPGYLLFFHDTHHRMVTNPAAMERYALADYDGVLAYGRILQELYERSGRVKRAWTWHEAADIRVFRPLTEERPAGDLVWVGNWGDGERTAELEEFLIQPARNLRLAAKVYGVRYPDAAKLALANAGIGYGGWLPNFEVPRVFARYRVTVHVPRRPYVKALPGIPTIRPFEALACGIPLVCSPWDDVEGLFTAGKDYLIAHTGRQMERCLQDLLGDKAWRQHLAAHGLQTVRAKHTCAHRVDELLAICAEVHPPGTPDTAFNPHITLTNPL